MRRPGLTRPLARPLRLGHHLGQQRRPLGARPIQHVLPVYVQDVEDEQAQRDPPSFWRANREPVTWNGSGRPSGRSAIASPSSTAALTGNASAASNDLRHTRGHVVQATRVYAYVVVATVDLHACAVELPLHRGLPQPPKCLVDVLRRSRQHGPHRPPDLEPEPIHAPGPSRNATTATALQVAAEHERPLHRRSARPAAARASACTMTPSRAPCRSSPPRSRRRNSRLPRRRTPEQLDKCTRRARLRPRDRQAPRSARTPRPPPPTVRLGHIRGRRQVPQRRPANPDLALTQLTRRNATPVGDLLGRQPLQDGSDPLHLFEP